MASAFSPSGKATSSKAVGSVEVREEEEPPQEDGWMEVGRRNRMVVTRTVSIFIQGILSFKFKVFGYFDLPLICSVYYGFTLGNPIASIVIGSSLGLMQDSLSGAILGANGLPVCADFEMLIGEPCPSVNTIIGYRDEPCLSGEVRANG